MTLTQRQRALINKDIDIIIEDIDGDLYSLIMSICKHKEFQNIIDKKNEKFIITEPSDSLKEGSIKIKECKIIVVILEKFLKLFDVFSNFISQEEDLEYDEADSLLDKYEELFVNFKSVILAPFLLKVFDYRQEEIRKCKIKGKKFNSLADLQFSQFNKYKKYPLSQYKCLTEDEMRKNCKILQLDYDEEYNICGIKKFLTLLELHIKRYDFY